MGVVAANNPDPAAAGFQQPQQVQPPLPPLPIANSGNLVDTVNAIRQVVQQLGSPATTPKGNNHSGTNSGQSGNKQSKQKTSRWVEQSRQTGKVRVYNPDDHEQYVDVEQINQLTMRDQITGATWVWSR
jgi:hypothetical protein